MLVLPLQNVTIYKLQFNLVLLFYKGKLLEVLFSVLEVQTVSSLIQQQIFSPISNLDIIITSLGEVVQQVGFGMD